MENTTFQNQPELYIMVIVLRTNHINTNHVTTIIRKRIDLNVEKY